MNICKNNSVFWFKRLFEPKKQASVEAESLYMILGELADTMNKSSEKKNNKPLRRLFLLCKGLF